MNIYTLGHIGQSFNRFEEWVKNNRAMIIDVRHSPRSKTSQWNEPHLKKIFGSQYQHIPELGNANHKQAWKPVQLVDAAFGIQLATLAAQRYKNVVILGSAPNEHRCHRGVVAASLAEIFNAKAEPLNLNTPLNVGEKQDYTLQEALAYIQSNVDKEYTIHAIRYHITNGWLRGKTVKRGVRFIPKPVLHEFTKQIQKHFRA